uniref:J domain-containing protein n=1 Tax=Syphacia muris TaxID=451379 RepID=A0A0N5AK67_9BILA
MGGGEESESYYDILGVTKNATEHEIKNSYRKLALKYHPDRNPGNAQAAEQFKKVSIAYAVLSNPNSRRQYDLSGPLSTPLDFEGIDISEVGGVGRVFCALFSKLGVPIPTQITPKVLAQAKALVEGSATDAQYSVLEEGVPYDGKVGKQEAAFFKLTMREEFQKYGILIICKSFQMSKFKLVLFDNEGAVRYIQESEKRKDCTVAEIYFVPFNRTTITEFIPLKFYMEDRETPLAFHLLDSLEVVGSHTLEERDHFLCVYGDNWIKNIRYHLQVIPLNGSENSLSCDELVKKKSEMAKFQTEYVEAERKHKEVVERLKRESEEIEKLLKVNKLPYC